MSTLCNKDIIIIRTFSRVLKLSLVSGQVLKKAGVHNREVPLYSIVT